MATRAVELDRVGLPRTVFHRFNREAWSHGYTEACDVCRKAGFTVAFRRRVLSAVRQEMGVQS